MRLCDNCSHPEDVHYSYTNQDLIPCRRWERSDDHMNIYACGCPDFEYDDFAHWVRDQRAAHRRTRHGTPITPAQNSSLRQFLATNRWERQKR